MRPVIVVPLPGELSVGFALDISARLGNPDAVVLGYCNGVPEYIPYPPVEYDAGGNEVDGAHCFYGQPSRLSPDRGPILIGAATSAVEALAD